LERTSYIFIGGEEVAVKHGEEIIASERLGINVLKKRKIITASPLS
jgi:hypothetical protein